MTNKYSRFLILVILCVLSDVMSARTVENQISDMGRAMEYCQNSPLEKIEGIWEFPADETQVLVRRDRAQKKRIYEIIVVSTPDCRLNPGDKIGELTPTVDDKKFGLSLYRSKRDGILTDPGSCAAIFSDRDGTIKIEKRKFKINLSSRLYRLLPEFWRLLSVFKWNDPAAALPEGLIRIYPYPRTSKSSSPIYL